MNLFARKPTEDSALAGDGSGTQQTKPSAPVSWKDFGAAQQREADENRSSTIWQRQHRSFYLPVKGKFALSTAFACAWVFLSWNLAQPWLSELANDIGYAPAVVIIFFIALFPGFLNAHIISSVILDRPPELRFDIEYPPINLLIAAYNEAQEIAETIRGIKGQDYPGRIDIIVVDDGSTDNTISILNSFDLPNLKIIRANHGGKAKALNEGLNHVSHDIIVCIDADTFLQPEALKRLVARFLSDPQGTAAVAGCVLVKNSRDTFMTRLQEWDYFTGIASA
jgi:biofilm PGA synthesis N-glycosyltransferase PgaC